MKVAIIASALLICLTGLFSYLQWWIMPYLVILSVFVITIFVTTGVIKAKEYPVYLFAMSLALVWQTTMLGSYIVGADIHGEISIVNKTIADGWNFSYYNPNSTSIIIGWLSPLLDKVGFDPIWQFKAFYPIFLATVPVILYFAYKKMLGDKRAFYASLFFMLMPVFFLEIVGIVKSMIAEVLFAFVVFLMSRDMNFRKKALGICGCLIAATFIHYTISIIIILLLFGALCVSIFGWIARAKFLRNIRVHNGYVSIIIVISVGLTILWYGNVGGGSLLYSYKLIFNAFGKNIITYAEYVNPLSPTFGGRGEVPDATEGITTPVKSDSDTPKDDDESVSYLYKQEPLVMMAIGLDFVKATIEGKVFRVVQIITQLLIIIGFAYAILRYKRYKFTSEFLALATASLGLLGLCVFVPSLSSLTNMTRFYHCALFFLAPMLVIGVDGLSNDMGKVVIWARKQR